MLGKDDNNNNSEPQKGCEPTTLPDLVAALTTELLETVLSKGEMWEKTTTASRSHIV